MENIVWNKIKQFHEPPKNYQKNVSFHTFLITKNLPQMLQIIYKMFFIEKMFRIIILFQYYIRFVHTNLKILISYIFYIKTSLPIPSNYILINIKIKSKNKIKKLYIKIAKTILIL